MHLASKKIFRDGFLILITTIFANLCAYFLQWEAIKILSPENLGNFSISWQLITLFSIPALSTQYFMAKAYLQSPISSAQTVLFCLLMLAIALIVFSPWLINLFSTNGHSYFLLITCGFLLILLHLQLGIFQAQSNYNKFTLLTFLLGLIKIVPTGIMLGKSVDYSLTAYLLSLLLLNIIYLGYSPLKFTIFSIPGASSQKFKLEKNSLSLFLSSFNIQTGIFIYLSLDLIIAAKILDSTKMGYYAAGNFVTKIGFWLLQIIILLIFPEMQKNKFTPTKFKQIYFSLIGIAALTIVIISLTETHLGPYLLGDNYYHLSPFLWKFACYGINLFLLEFSLLYAFSKELNSLLLLTSVWLQIIIQTITLCTLAKNIEQIVNYSLVISFSGLIINYLLLIFFLPKINKQTSRNTQ